MYIMRGKVIILAGAPKSGKSTLMRSIQEKWQFSGKKVFFLEANVDGEGFWSKYFNGKTSQQQIKKELFSKFMEFMQKYVQYTINLSKLGFDIFVSLGGKPSQENAYFYKSIAHLQPITLLLIPFEGKNEKFIEWVEFMKKLRVGDVIIASAKLYPLRIYTP